MTHITAQQLIDEVLDPHTFQSWDETPHYGTISDDYQAAIDRAKTKSGVDEAVITGEGMISGTRVAFVLSEFTFLGGSIGAATARRIITAIHRATAEQLPLLISPSSGGTRMQEGTPAFALMVSITTAVYRHKDAHLPFIVYLRNPTTGGVLASWGSATSPSPNPVPSSVSWGRASSNSPPEKPSPPASNKASTWRNTALSTVLFPPNNYERPSKNSPRCFSPPPAAIGPQHNPHRNNCNRLNPPSVPGTPSPPPAAPTAPDCSTSSRHWDPTMLSNSPAPVTGGSPPRSR